MLLPRTLCTALLVSTCVLTRSCLRSSMGSQSPDTFTNGLKEIAFVVWNWSSPQSLLPLYNPLACVSARVWMDGSPPSCLQAAHAQGHPQWGRRRRRGSPAGPPFPAQSGGEGHQEAPWRWQ